MNLDRALYESHPELGVVLENASALIEAALEPSMILTSEANPVQVRFIPGRSVIAQLSATVETDSEETTTETFVASIGLRVAPETAIVTAGNTDIAIWRLPADPFLPGLRSVSDRESASRLLEQLEVDPTGISWRRRAYRPGRRAVMELRTPRDRVFAKVVRPARVAELQRLHTSLAGQAPIPMSLGWSETSGIALLQALDGRPLRHSIERGDDPLPSPGALIDLLATLEVPPVGDPRPSLVDRARDHAAFLSTVYPDLQPCVHTLARSIAEMADPEPLRTIHGDFHSSQIMVNDGSITGLVDIDTVSSGERTDDLANFLAHLAAVALARPDIANNVTSYGVDLTSTFDTVADPRQLRLRVAAALLGYAGGPFRVQQTQWRQATEERVQTAEQWLNTAKTTPI
jgi:aminoglycoside phosphotransferase (APT) family kinase protein